MTYVGVHAPNWTVHTECPRESESTDTRLQARVESEAVALKQGTVDESSGSATGRLVVSRPSATKVGAGSCQSSACERQLSCLRQRHPRLVEAC